ncbi:hypothetical protein J7554_08140 [Wohlfahrtiimonas chitiniclastica]|uniref:hypothetical protein n=1 Tax=Wohlfahrtiimonas chitiniclastica TaxID=400946 RepID=UPI001BCEB284|nr:hypothetical protein [Wohlfahrtiimonas chitiniclastica]MBS7829094.1 hypothetical protein [Wohlfahrtiimonas chitiniclastica]
MNDYLDNPKKIHSDIINALKAISVLVIPAAALFLFNIAIYAYKMAYFSTFHLPFIPIESSLWLDVVENKTLVILLLTLLFFAIGIITAGVFLFRHSLEKIANQEFSWSLFIATFVLLSPFIFSLHGLSLSTQVLMIVLYALLIPFLFTKHFHITLHHLSHLLPEKFHMQKKEKAVLHDIAFIILGITYLFVIFIMFILLMESVAGRLGTYHAKEVESIMRSNSFEHLPEHIKVNGTSLYLEACDARKCLGYQAVIKNNQTVIQPKFFTVYEIDFINPEVY